MWKLEKNGDPKYFIEGPGRLTSALETLNAPKADNTEAAHHPKDKPGSLKGGGSQILACRTIVASDNDVSNGFVKDGKALPYVFEATESGLRKRSNKILPVCGVCGKKFVCVTTMKRHLVTHTGEKPFSCKVCGKQYTQKGNLRVHERTHRNDRPFECNICHQKFYRKEPMQKHQWRQHAIVHFKSRPTNTKEEEVPLQQVAEEAPSVAIPLDVVPSMKQPQPPPAALHIPTNTTAADTLERPCLKHKMKLAQAYLREQRELGENLSSSGRDIVGLLNLSLREEDHPHILQCRGCNMDFEDSGALLSHVRPTQDSYVCCQCAAEFSQKNLFSQHQQVCRASTKTFTMQELIERGVEKSMSGGDSDLRSPSPPSMPLDLSPGKSVDILVSRANNPLLNNRPIVKEDAPSSSAVLSPAYKKQKTSSTNVQESSPESGKQQLGKLQSWKDMSPYIKSDFVRSSDQMRLNNMDRNRPQDGRTV